MYNDDNNILILVQLIMINTNDKTIKNAKPGSNIL